MFAGRKHGRALMSGALLLLPLGCREEPAPPEWVPMTVQPADLAVEPIPDARADSSWESALWRRFLEAGPAGGLLPDFSRVGYRGGDEPLPQPPDQVIDPGRFGAVPDDG